MTTPNGACIFTVLRVGGLSFLEGVGRRVAANLGFISKNK
jgi:hypothetical protein